MGIPTIYDIKPRFQACLRPMSGQLAEWGVTANQVTLLAVALSMTNGLAIAMFPQQAWPLLLLPLVLFLRMALNAVDGMLAREHAMKSPLGGMLNELGDVFSDAVLYLPLMVRSEGSGIWIFGFVLLAVVSEMAGVLGVAIGASRRYDGPLGKSDRAFLIGLLALLLGLGVPVGPWFDVMFMGLSILAAATITQRVRAALGEVGG